MSSNFKRAPQLPDNLLANQPHPRHTPRRVFYGLVGPVGFFINAIIMCGLTITTIVVGVKNGPNKGFWIIFTGAISTLVPFLSLAHASVWGRFRFWRIQAQGAADSGHIQSCLDIGCTTGFVMFALVQEARRRGILGGCKFVGIDSFRLLSNIPNDPKWIHRNSIALDVPPQYLSVYCLSTFNEEMPLPFPDHTFTLITSFSGLSKTGWRTVDRLAALNECLRVLKPGGKIILAEESADCTPYKDYLKRTHQWINVKQQADWLCWFGWQPLVYVEGVKPVSGSRSTSVAPSIVEA